jgi:flagellar M-ring protein FliF
VKAKAEGTDTILVPEVQADELRIRARAQGYPSTGLNYDIFPIPTEVGSTDLERQTYLQYQLQENMRTTICRMSRVRGCIVIVNLATSSSFVLSDNATEASVAVLLSLENNETLTNAEAKTIGAFVMKCVPKLKLENVSIVDSEMHYYDITSEGSGEQEDSDYPDAQNSPSR